LSLNYREIRSECRNILNELRLLITDLERGPGLRGPPGPDPLGEERILVLRQMLRLVLDIHLRDRQEHLPDQAADTPAGDLSPHPHPTFTMGQTRIWGRTTPLG